MPEPTLERLEPIEENSLGTRAISRIKDKHGDDLRISLGSETGPLGTWINFYVRDKHVATLDYFALAGIDPEKNAVVTFYIHPDYL